MRRVGRNHFAILRVHGPRDHRRIAPGHPHRHHDRLGRARRALVHRRVRNLHAGQLADHRLELKHRLQRPLRDLRLVGRVARQKLTALHQRIDDHRLVVLVHARTQKACVPGRIVVRVPTKALDDLRLAVLARDIQIRVKLVLRRDR